MSRRRQAFTLIEVLVVIAILAILMGILVWGMGGFGNAARAKNTRSRMDTLKSMTEALRLANNLKDVPRCDNSNRFVRADGTLFNGWPPAMALYNLPGDVRAGMANHLPVPAGNGPPGNAVALTQRGVMGLLRSIPANATTLSNLNAADFYLRDDNNNRVDPPVLVDGWGNPIVFVPGGPASAMGNGMSNLGIGGMVVQRKDGVQIRRQAPNNLGFWASAGPDGNLSTDADNIYSFEN